MTTSRRNRNRGKDAERAVAKLFGGRRLGTMGGEDVEHHLLSIEVKSRVSFVGRAWYDQAKANNPAPMVKLPIVVVFQKGSPREKGQVLVGIEDFQKLLAAYEKQFGD